MYLIAGGITTLVSYGTYALFYAVLGLPNMASEVLSWILAVASAFVMNKIMVFESRSWESSVWVPEAVKFVGARLGTGVLEWGLMYLAVDVLHISGLIAKLPVSVLIVIGNYFISKFLVFRKKNNQL